MLLKTTFAGLFFLILSFAAPRAHAQRVVIREQPRRTVVVRERRRRAVRPRRVIVQQPRRTVIVRGRR